jgi:hypothetical protein
MTRKLLVVPLLLVTGVALAEDVPEAKRAAPAPEAQSPDKTDATDEAKALSGMSVLGNQEAPKALVIVPWKGSEIGNSLGISTMLDDSRQPIDKEVFMRALSYYEIRSTTTRHDGAAAEPSDAARPATAAHRR